jgi:hypothetical protein
MEVYCPHCRESVSFADDSTEKQRQTCPQCGSSIEQAGVATCSHNPGDTQTIGRFQLESKLGSGAFGTVWAARDSQLERVVAIKVLDDWDEELVQREARSAARLRHPNIVAVHEATRLAGGPATIPGQQPRLLSSPQLGRPAAAGCAVIRCLTVVQQRVYAARVCKKKARELPLAPGVPVQARTATAF